MKRSYKTTTVIVLLISFIYSAKGQNIGINTTGATPNTSAILDLNTGNSGNTGFLPEQVGLVSLTDGVTITNPATGLFVFNNGTGGLLPAGYYYNSGTPVSPLWLLLSTNAWLLTGNSGTNSGINFIGTTDNNSLRIDTHDSTRLMVDSLGRVGIKTITPNTVLDVNGSFAYREGNSLALSNGANNNVAIGNYSFFRITGPTAAFSITGLTGGTDGRIITLYNTTTQVMTISNANAGSSAVNQITTMTGADIITPAGPNILQFQYNVTTGKWLLIGGQNITASTAGGGDSPCYTCDGW